jgi:hypothetical protein
MITFMCVHCNEELKVPDNTAGKRGKCPHCGKVVQIPQQAPPMEAVVEPEPATFAVAPMPAPSPAAVSTTPMPMPMMGSAPSLPAAPALPPTQQPAPVSPPAEEPVGPMGGSGSVLSQSGLELTVCSIVLGLGAMLFSSSTVLGAITIFSKVVLFLWWICVTGTSGFGLYLGIMGLRAPRSRTAPGFWLALSGLVLCGVALLGALITLLFALTAGPSPRSF